MAVKGELIVNAKIVNADAVNKRLQSVKGSISDMRPLFASFSSQFYNYERQIFQLPGPGKYEDLSEKYKWQKLNKRGFLYPILKDTGRLSDSLLSPKGFGAINVIQKQVFLIGTSIKYGIFHQSIKARTKIPHRPFIIFHGPGAGKFTFNPVDGGNLRDHFIRIIDKYVDRVLKGKSTKNIKS